MSRFAAAVSEHPVTALAIGEVAGEVAQALTSAPDIALLFLTTHHLEHLADIVDVIEQVVVPDVLLTVTASGVVGGGREVEDAPGLSLWAGSTGPVVPVRLEVRRVAGLGYELVSEPSLEGCEGTLVLLADPFSVPLDSVLEELHGVAPRLQVVGGLASGANRAGGNRLGIDATMWTAGAVGALLPVDLDVQVVVSQGCRPIGDPMIVTRVDNDAVGELAGRPALDQLRTLIETANAAEQALLETGIHAGIVIDERKLDFDRGDFLIRDLIDGDQATGALTINDRVEVGATLQFQVRDALSADEDLRALLGAAGALRRQSEAALLFTCTARGRHLFGLPDHDASIVYDAVYRGATAGMFCAGEVGPVGDRNFLHSYTASVLLFGLG
jgi:small ligand-binding sensory domain FIST